MASDYWQILQGVQNSIQTVTGFSSANVLLRKKITLVQADYPLAQTGMVVIAPGKGGEFLRIQTFNRNLAYSYPVLIAYVTGGNKQIAQGLQQFLDTRELIRDQLFQTTLTGVTPVWDTNFKDNETGEAIDWGPFKNTEYDYAMWQVLYNTTELRKS